MMCIFGYLIKVLILFFLFFSLLDCGRHKAEPCYIDVPKPFSVAKYCERMERAHLDILEHQEPVDQTIILWWGLDGLTMDENGELKWLSRKEQESVNQNVSYQPCQTIITTFVPQYPTYQDFATALIAGQIPMVTWEKPETEI